MPATDQAKFYADYHHPWHLNPTNTHLYLCRPTPTGLWENALLHRITHYPPHEITDPYQGEVANATNRLWLEPEDWLPLDHAPTHSPQDGHHLFQTYLLKTMYKTDPNGPQKLDALIRLAKGRTHNQFLQLLDEVNKKNNQ